MYVCVYVYMYVRVYVCIYVRMYSGMITLTNAQERTVILYTSVSLL